MPKGTITLNDIATKLYVSAVTVSKALRNHPDISKKTNQLLRSGKPPALFKVECTNKAQSIKEAACTGLTVTYHGPWLGTEGRPSYANVTMNFSSTHEVIFAEDFTEVEKDSNT